MDLVCCAMPLVLVLFVCIAGHLQRKQQARMDELRSIFAEARKGHITDVEADRFFDCADKAKATLKGSCRTEEQQLEDKEEIDRMSSQITMILATRAPAVSMGEDIDTLARLRQQGMISDHEFQAFSERFKLSSGDKASGIVKAISELHEKHKQGAMSEGNYHAALWSLLDKLDRKI